MEPVTVTRAAAVALACVFGVLLFVFIVQPCAALIDSTAAAFHDITAAGALDSAALDDAAGALDSAALDDAAGALDSAALDDAAGALDSAADVFAGL